MACFIIAADHGSGGRIARVSPGLAPERARRARGGRLRPGRAGARVRHARVRLRGGRHARAGARPTSRPSGRARAASRWSTRARPSRARRRSACSGRGGPLVRRGLRRRAPPRARGRLRPGADLHARQQQDRRRSSTTRSSAAWGTSSSTRSTRSSGCAGRAERVLIRVTPGIEARTHSYIQTGQEDSKFGFPPRRGAAGGGALRARPASSCAGCTRTSARRCSSWRPSSGWPRCCAGSATGRCSTSAAASASPTPPRTRRRPSRTTPTRCCATRPRA